MPSPFDAHFLGLWILQAGAFAPLSPQKKKHQHTQVRPCTWFFILSLSSECNEVRQTLWISAWHSNAKFHKNPPNCSWFGDSRLTRGDVSHWVVFPDVSAEYSVFITFEEGGTRCCRNPGEQSTGDAAQHPIRRESSPKTAEQTSNLAVFFEFLQDIWQWRGSEGVQICELLCEFVGWGWRWRKNG